MRREWWLWNGPVSGVSGVQPSGKGVTDCPAGGGVRYRGPAGWVSGSVRSAATPRGKRGRPEKPPTGRYAYSRVPSPLWSEPPGFTSC